MSGSKWPVLPAWSMPQLNAGFTGLKHAFNRACSRPVPRHMHTSHWPGACFTGSMLQTGSTSRTQNALARSMLHRKHAPDRFHFTHTKRTGQEHASPEACSRPVCSTPAHTAKQRALTSLQTLLRCSQRFYVCYWNYCPQSHQLCASLTPTQDQIRRQQI
jgi:hypothetical protein